ncbi:MAG: transporter substrate-binding domain-containing protein [Muribaculaceae bacterium]|nr:transporter substrate-binding domain-containing protein [Muribaculaceae bacterium]
MRQNYKKKGLSPWLYLIFLAIAVGGMAYIHKVGENHATMPVADAGDDDCVRVCIQYAPISYYIYDDTIGGFEHDLMQMVAQRAGWKVKYEPVVSVDAGISTLEAGDCDILIAQIPVTANMREKMLFSQPIYLDRQTLVQLRDTASGAAITNQLQLAGDTVMITKGSPIKERIAALGEEMGAHIEVIEDDDYNAEQLFLMVARGEIRNAVISDNVARHMAQDYPQVDISVDVSLAQIHAWAFPKEDTALCDTVNAVLSEICQSCL